MCRRQERVKRRQPVVNGAGQGAAEAFTGGVIEQLVAGLLALALIVYLVYALVRPERF